MFSEARKRGFVALLLATLVGAPAAAAPPSAEASVQVNVKITKPLSLTSSGVLNFGTIILNGLTTARTVSLSPANILSCGGGSAELLCIGATSVPTYNVQGTNRMIVSIIKTTSTLTNSMDGATLTLTPSGPSTIELTNSGNPGENFRIGGSISVTSSTTDGVYSGVVDVTVDYQ